MCKWEETKMPLWHDCQCETSRNLQTDLANKRKISEVMGTVLIYKNQFQYKNEELSEFYSQVLVYTLLYMHTQEEILGSIFMLKTKLIEEISRVKWWKQVIVFIRLMTVHS